MNSEQTTAARVGVRWQPTDAIDANLTYYFQDMEVGGRQQNHVVAFGTGKYESATRYLEPNERAEPARGARDHGRSRLRAAHVGDRLLDVLGPRAARSDRSPDHVRVQLRAVPDVLGVHARRRGRPHGRAKSCASSRTAPAGSAGSAACSGTTRSNVGAEPRVHAALRRVLGRSEPSARQPRVLQLRARRPDREGDLRRDRLSAHRQAEAHGRRPVLRLRAARSRAVLAVPLFIHGIR